MAAPQPNAGAPTRHGHILARIVVAPPHPSLVAHP
jgi:hypothetical protein